MAVEHEAPEEVIQALRQKVLDARTSLPAKYRALFALRNLKGPSAEAAIIDGTFVAFQFHCTAHVIAVSTSLVVVTSVRQDIHGNIHLVSLIQVGRSDDVLK